MLNRIHVSLLLMVLCFQLEAQQVRFSNLGYFGRGRADVVDMLEVSSDEFLAIVLESDTLTTPVTVSSFIKLNRNGQIVFENLISRPDTGFSVRKMKKIDGDLVLLGNFTFNTTKPKPGIIFLNPQTLAVKHEIILPYDSLEMNKSNIQRLPDSSYTIIAGMTPRNDNTLLVRLNKDKTLRSFKVILLSRGVSEVFFSDFFFRPSPPTYIVHNTYGLSVFDTTMRELRFFPGFDSLRIFFGEGNMLRLNDTSYLTTAIGGFNAGSERNNFLVYNQSTNGPRRFFSEIRYQGEWINGNSYKTIDTTRQGEIFVGGFRYINFATNFTTSSLMLSKLDNRYNTLWTRFYEPDGLYTGNGILATSDGGCIAYGSYTKNRLASKKRYAYFIKVDGNGRTVSETTIPLSTPTLKVFPNPAQAEIQVALPTEIETFDYRIYDSQGKLVQQKNNVSSAQNIGIQTLATGSYVLQIWQKGQLLGVSQWVKTE
jgi:hypothetical protein